MSECSRISARERRRLLLIVCVSLIGYIVSSQAALRVGSGPYGILLASLAGLFFFAELIGAGLLIYRRFDEFQRVLLLRSFLWASVITMGLTMVWGFTELHMHDHGPRMPALAVPAILIACTALAKLLIFRQHRPESE